MPLSEHYAGKGRTVMAKMKETYGDSKGKKVFYGTENKRKGKMKFPRLKKKSNPGHGY